MARHPKIRYKFDRTIRITNLKLYKQDKGCAVCGESDPNLLSFHHIDPRKKKFNISEHAFTTNNIKDIVKEIAKCDVLCDEHHKEANLKNKKAKQNEKHKRKSQKKL